MKMMKSLLLGSAAGLVAIAGAQAADLPVKAKPVDYVRICTAYGAGFYYIPGTDICLRVGGFVFAQADYNSRTNQAYVYSTTVGADGLLNRDDNRTSFRVRSALIMDARAQTSIGTVRSYFVFGATVDNAANGFGFGGNNNIYFERAFIQFAGFTAGFVGSFFDFGGYYTLYTQSTYSLAWLAAFAYTANFGNGVSGTLSIEDAQARRSRISTVGGDAFTGGAQPTTSSYGGQEIPDIVANLRVDQPWGSAQVSGALHQLRLNQVASITHSDKFGYAVLGGIEIKTPMIAPGDSIVLQGVWSKGAVQYTGVSANPSTLTSIIGLKSGAVPGVGPIGWIYDAVPSVFTGALELTTAWSANISYRHFWQPNLRSAISVGYVSVEPAKPNPAFNYGPDVRLWQAGLSTIWSPAPTLDLGVDVLYSRVDTGACPNAAAAVQLANCNISADIWSVLTRWRRNF